MSTSVSNTRRLLHWGPIIALSIISMIAFSTLLCILEWWPPNTVGGVCNLAVFLLWAFLTIYHILNAAFIGPGTIPFGWTPQDPDDRQSLQYCSSCEGYKAPRSHHCRKCGKCVMKMDHHCPWINNCVGHRNHAYFTQFLFFAPVGCIHSLCIVIPSLYRAINKNLYIMTGLSGSVPIVNLGVYPFIFSMFSIGLAIGVILAVGGLCFIQVRTILRNETGIESWIKEKAEYRDLEDDEEEFVYPYNLGRYDNWRMVFSWTPRPELNGIWWPVVEGCTQYTITIEQIKQKLEKQQRSVLYSIVEAYSGSLCPIGKGIRVVCCVPFSDEPRVPLKVGGKVQVTRWKKHWLYGNVLHNMQAEAGEGRVRGWFPRRCVVEEYGPIDDRYEGDQSEWQGGKKKDN